MSEYLGPKQNLYDQYPFPEIMSDESVFPQGFFKTESGFYAFCKSTVSSPGHITRGARTAIEPKHRSKATVVEARLASKINEYQELSTYLNHCYRSKYTGNNGNPNNSREEVRTYVAWLANREEHGYHGDKNLSVFSKVEDVISSLPAKRKPNRRWRFFRSQDD